jgi:hypothetical protein
MKTITFIILGLITSQLLNADNGTLNYYVLNNVDTTYVNNLSEITNCNFLISCEKSHNKCLIIINDKPYSGKIHYHISRVDSTLQVFDGNITNGLIQNGTVLRYSKSGQLILSGQYFNNWKYGMWTSYYNTGQVETIMKFIEYADYPIVEWEYDKTGRLVYHNNEQKEIEEIIKKTR